MKHDKEGIGYLIGFEHEKDRFIRDFSVVDYFPPLTYSTSEFCAHLFLDVISAYSFILENGLVNRNDVTIWTTEHVFGSPSKMLHKRSFKHLLRRTKIEKLLKL